MQLRHVDVGYRFRRMLAKPPQVGARFVNGPNVTHLRGIRLFSASPETSCVRLHRLSSTDQLDSFDLAVYGNGLTVDIDAASILERSGIDFSKRCVHDDVVTHANRSPPIA